MGHAHHSADAKNFGCTVQGCVKHFASSVVDLYVTGSFEDLVGEEQRTLVLKMDGSQPSPNSSRYSKHTIGGFSNCWQTVVNMVYFWFFYFP